MHILIPVFFNAPLGGLHENVLSTALFCRKNNFDITVLCKSGPFQKKLIKLGVNVMTTDFSDDDLINTMNKIIELNETKKIDIIHTHPFASRVYANHISRLLDIPLVITFHGMHTDKLEKYIHETDLVFTVSEGIKNFLLAYLENKEVKNYKQKFFVVSNGVNLREFRYNSTKPMNVKDTLNISLVTRLDKDKQFILDVFFKALAFTSEHYPEKITWTVVGDGTEKEAIINKAKDITKDRNELRFIGWKENRELVDEYLKADILLAPGRCALEGMSAGKPVIALGSKGYIGLINETNWRDGVYSNFGGVGNKFDNYIEGSVERDLKRVIESHIYRERLGNLSTLIIDQFYNEDILNEKLMTFYKIVHETSERKKNGLTPESLQNFLRSKHILEISPYEKNEYLFKAKCPTFNGIKYAWYIYFNNEVIHKTKYSDINTLSYNFSKKGAYRIKSYVKVGSSVISNFSPIIDIE